MSPPVLGPRGKCCPREMGRGQRSALESFPNPAEALAKRSPLSPAPSVALTPCPAAPKGAGGPAATAQAAGGLGGQAPRRSFFHSFVLDWKEFSHPARCRSTAKRQESERLLGLLHAGWEAPPRTAAVPAAGRGPGLGAAGGDQAPSPSPRRVPAESRLAARRHRAFHGTL